MAAFWFVLLPWLCGLASINVVAILKMSYECIREEKVPVSVDDFLWPSRYTALFVVWPPTWPAIWVIGLPLYSLLRCL